MLHFVVNLIDQCIPILDLAVALLVEVGSHRYVVKEHGVDVKRVVRTDEGKDASGAVTGPTLINGEVKGLLGLPLALLDVGLLPVEGRAGHDYCWLAAGREMEKSEMEMLGVGWFVEGASEKGKTTEP